MIRFKKFITCFAICLLGIQPMLWGSDGCPCGDPTYDNGNVGCRLVTAGAECGFETIVIWDELKIIPCRGVLGSPMCTAVVACGVPVSPCGSEAGVCITEMVIIREIYSGGTQCVNCAVQCVSCDKLEYVIETNSCVGCE